MFAAFPSTIMEALYRPYVGLVPVPIGLMTGVEVDLIRLFGCLLMSTGFARF